MLISVSAQEFKKLELSKKYHEPLVEALRRQCESHSEAIALLEEIAKEEKKTATDTKR